MKYQQIQIGGKLRPVRFSFAALYEYEQTTGRNALADFAAFQDKGMSVTIAADLIFCGLNLGLKTIGKTADFTAYDVADWVFGDPALIERVMKLFADSFPGAATDEEGGEEDEPKKTKPTESAGTDG